jgi:CubicO group peptidase (beta-lactamase class C family)
LNNGMNLTANPQDALPRATEIINQGISEGWHIGAQVYVSVGGKPVADFAIGEARRGVPMTNDTLMLWLSAVKPVGAVAIAQLWEQGRLGLDDRVCRFIPEFGTRGKEVVTLRHILTHTGGFPKVEGVRRLATQEEVLANIYNAELEPGWVPGRKAGYHPASSWHILGEVLRRLDGRPFDRYVRDEIFEPLVMRDSWIGMPSQRSEEYGDRLGIMHMTEGSTPLPLRSEFNDDRIPYRPGGSGWGPMRELGRFYETLLFRGQRDGTRILSTQTVEALTARHRVGMYDETLQHVIDWGLGFIIDSNMYGAETVPYGYGLHCSPRTFGHSGNQSSVGFCDPENGLVVAWVFNGTPGERCHQQRARAMNTAIYQDLKLA